MAVTFDASDTAGFVALVFPDESGGVIGAQAVIGIPQYNIIFQYDLKGQAEQVALPDEHHALMDASVEAIDGDIVLKFKKFLLEQGQGVNDIIVDGPQNFIYAFSDIVGEGQGSNRGKYVINISLDGRSKFSDPNQFKWLSNVIMLFNKPNIPPSHNSKS